MKLLVPIALLLTSCASVTSEKWQELTIYTEPAGAECTLRNEKDSWLIDTTPEHARVTRSFSPLKIHCSKDALQGSTVIEARTRSRAYGNILMGGFPAYVDAATEKGYEYFPEEITIKLKD